MRTVLASILLLASGALANNCQRTREGKFIYECCPGGSKVPVGCITPDNQELACGSTTNVFQNGELGFVFSCSRPDDHTIQLKPTGCVLRSGQHVSIGQTIIFNNYNYLCADKGNGMVHFQVQGCVNNGAVVHVGNTCNYCVNQQCQTMKCVSNGHNHVQLVPVVCVAPDGTQVSVGSNHVIYNGQTGIVYTCQEKGTSTPTITATGCACNGQSVGFGSTITVGTTQYLCTGDENKVTFQPQSCTAPNGQLINIGQSITVRNGQNGIIYTCQEAGMSTTAVATGCDCNGQSVGFGQTMRYGNTVYNCTNQNGLVSQSCTDSNGQTVNVGESRTIFTGSMGFTYTCEANGNSLTLKPTGCAVSGGASVTIGNTIHHGSTSYLCHSDAHGKLSFKPQACIDNGVVVSVGGTTKICTGSSCFSMQCTQSNGDSVSFQPKGCIASDGAVISIGSTHNVFTNNFGFVYSCIQDGNSVQFKPTGCVLSGGVSTPFGGTVIYKDFNYLCNYSNGVVSYIVHDCVINGKVIPVGGSDKVCNNQQCQTKTCIRHGPDSIALETRECTFGHTSVQVGGQCIWQNQRCFCDPQTPICVTI